ncbi:hypothetical protein V8F20_009825 [Naviculisporaceae sp. PSN 640]
MGAPTISLPVFLAAITIVTNIQRVHAFDPGDFLNKDPTTGKTNNGTVHDEIQCYALPYGAIGFASHILTYMTVICLSLGRNPLIPCLRLQNRKFNLAVAILGFFISFPLTVVTMVKCRNTWSFILIAVWKLTLSTTLTAMSIHAGRNIIEVPKPAKLKKRKKKKNPRGSSEGMIPMAGYGNGGGYPHLEPPRYSYPWSYTNHSRTPSPSPFGGPSPYISPSTHPYPYSPGEYFNRPGIAQYNQLHPNGTDHHDSDSEYEYYDSDTEEAAVLQHEQQKAEHKLIHKHIWQQPEYRAQFKQIWLWSPLYFFGAVVGFVGVMNIVRKNIASNHQLQIVTGVFGGVVAFMIIGVVILGLCAFGKVWVSLLTGIIVGIFVLTILFALYTDWALACMVGDVVGRPSRDNQVLYWLYFVAKRLPMLSI